MKVLFPFHDIHPACHAGLDTVILEQRKQLRCLGHHSIFNDRMCVVFLVQHDFFEK